MGKGKNKNIGKGTLNSPQLVLESGTISKKNSLSRAPFRYKMNVGKQNKHVKGTKEYVKGRSVITIPLSQLRPLTEEYYSNAVHFPSGHAVIKYPVKIGYYVNQKDGTKTKTNYETIHISKKGYHIVPANPRNQKKEKK